MKATINHTRYNYTTTQLHNYTTAQLQYIKQDVFGEFSMTSSTEGNN